MDELTCPGIFSSTWPATSAFFRMRKKCENSVQQRVQEKPKKTRRDPGLTENLEDLHRDRRSAQKTLLNSVHGVNLEDLHETPARNRIVNDLLGSQRILSWEKTGKTSISSSTTINNWNANIPLHNLLQQRLGYDRRHFHQLFHQLRLANCRSQGDVLRQDRGHFDNLLGIR